jgi:hypothetical protein
MIFRVLPVVPEMTSRAGISGGAISFRTLGILRLSGWA